MIIRPATRADIPCMLRLIEHSPTASRWSRQDYEGLFDANTFRRVALLCEDQSQVQGLLIAQGIGDEWEIENLAIAPEVRRRGFATKLLEGFLDQARAEGARAVFLEVRDSNRPARSLYEKSGFKEVGRRPRYYSQPIEDAVLYRRSSP